MREINKALLLMSVLILLVSSVNAGKLILDEELNTYADTGFNGATVANLDALTVGGWTLDGGAGAAYGSTGALNGNTVSVNLIHGADNGAHYTNASMKAENFSMLYKDGANTDHYIYINTLYFGRKSACSATNICCGSSWAAMTTDTGINNANAYQEVNISFDGAGTISLFIGGVKACSVAHTGGLDTIGLWTYTASIPTMSNISFWNTTADIPPLDPINMNITFPINNSLFYSGNISALNHNLTINVTHNKTGAVCGVNDTTNFHLTGNSTYHYYFSNSTPLIEQEYFILAYCNLSGYINGTASVQFEIDLTAPTITLNANNFFSSLNNTIFSNHSIPQNRSNITIYDANLMYANFSILNSSGSILYTNYSTNQGSYINYSDLIKFNWSLGNYTAIIEASDDHTAKTIENYKLTIKNNLFISRPNQRYRYIFN